jgi:hypothetical protein
MALTSVMVRAPVELISGQTMARDCRPQPDFHLFIDAAALLIHGMDNGLDGLIRRPVPGNHGCRVVVGRSDGATLCSVGEPPATRMSFQSMPTC